MKCYLIYASFQLSENLFFNVLLEKLKLVAQIEWLFENWIASLKWLLNICYLKKQLLVRDKKSHHSNDIV